MTQNERVGDGAEIYVWFLGIGFVLGGLFTYFLLPRLVDLPCSNKCIVMTTPDGVEGILITGGTVEDPLNIR